MATQAQAILAWLQAREDEMAALLLELVAAESPSVELGSERRALALLAEELRSSGYLTRLVRGHRTGDHLYARPRARRRGAPHQLVVGHIDTVWPLGSLREMPPRIENGRLYGPGAYDMKGGLAQLVFALRALDELGAVPPVTPVVFVNADEETGSLDSRRWIQLLAWSADRALVLEPPEGSNRQAEDGPQGRRALRGHDSRSSCTRRLQPGRGRQCDRTPGGESLCAQRPKARDHGQRGHD